MTDRHTAGRWLPPVHSPVGWRALLAGAAAWVSGSDSPRSAVSRWIRGRWGPADFVLTDRGTTALAMAIRIANSRSSGPVALPAWACYDVATATDMAGVPFVFYDLDPGTLAPAPDSLGAALAAGARSVVVVHLYGVPVDLGLVRDVVGPEVVVIEDAAQAEGAEVHGVPAGGVGHLGVLSFGRGKGLTGGGGGALLVNDAELCSHARAEIDRLHPGGRGSLLALGKLKAQWLLSRPGWYALPASLPFLRLGETEYHPPKEGRGIAASQAAVLDETIRLAADEVRSRQANARRLLADLGTSSALVAIRAPGGCTAGWLRLPVLAPPGAWRADRRTRRLGITPGYPLPLTRLLGFGSRAEGRTGAMPGAERLARELMTLPVHSWVADHDLVAVRARLAAVLDPRPGS